MIMRIKLAILKSWNLDRKAFIAEMVGVIFTIIASLTLAINAKDPNMVLIFPLYEAGSVSLVYAYYRREMVWSIGLTAYFIILNFIGFVIALP